MDKELIRVLSATMVRLQEQVRFVGLPNTDEATYRSFFLAEVSRQLPQLTCETEWNRVDLLLQHGSRNVLIEFKYYVERRSRQLDGSLGHWKGGPGPKNESEFWTCVEQLAECTFEPIYRKYLILVYQRGSVRGGTRYSYSLSYDSLTPGSSIERVIRVPHVMDSLLACNLIRVR